MKSLVLLFLLICTFGWAQKKELKQRCQQLEETILTKSYQVNYVLSVRAREDHGKPEAVHIQVSRNGNDQRITYGKYQEVVQQKDVIILVNHVQKAIVLQTEQGENSDAFLLKNLSALVDSAREVEVSGESGLKKFTLKYPKEHIYSKVEMTFSKGGELKMLFAEFSPQHPDAYHSIHVVYEHWEKNWKAEEGFPHADKYLTKVGDRYGVQPAWSQYTFYQPETGALKF